MLSFRGYTWILQTVIRNFLYVWKLDLQSEITHQINVTIIYICIYIFFFYNNILKAKSNFTAYIYTKKLFAILFFIYLIIYLFIYLLKS